MKAKQTAAMAVFPAIRAFAVILALSFTGPAFAQTSVSDLTGGLDAVLDRFNASLPLSAMQGLNWSSAYIGQLLGAPPHFGVGISAGVALINVDEIDTLLQTFGGTAGSLGLAVIPNPGYTVEARIGGFFLPFDIGIKAGYLPPVDLFKFSMDYLLVGGDIRYAILKDRVVIPAVSAGFGVNYLKGSLGYTFADQTFSGGTYNSISFGLKLDDPAIRFEWETWVFELKVQVSKSFILFTPYAGLGINYTKSTAGIAADTTVTVTGSSGASEADALASLGLAGNSAGFSRTRDLSGFGMRFFGGVSVNMAVIKLDITVMGATGTKFDFDRFTFGGGLGLRFQL